MRKGLQVALLFTFCLKSEPFWSKTLIAYSNVTCQLILAPDQAVCTITLSSGDMPLLLPETTVIFPRMLYLWELLNVLKVLCV